MKRNASSGTSAGRRSSAEGSRDEVLETDPVVDGDRTIDPTADPRSDEAREAESIGGDEITPLEYVESVAEIAVTDPVAAGDRIGDLLVVARDHGDARAAAGEVLNLVGLLRPAEFAVWIDDLVSFAGAADGELSFIGLRSIAQLAGENPRAAATGLDVAFDNLRASRTETRQAALSIVAEVGAERPRLVERADRHVANALGDADPGARLAGAITAGKLLGADPGSFPRTATALFDALDDDDDAVWEYAHVALVNFAQEHPHQIPDKERTIEILATVSDASLGVQEGATKEALAGLLTRDYDLEI